MILLKKRFIIPSASLLLVFWLITAIPATWLFHFVQHHLSGFQVSGVQGTLWDGSVEDSQWVYRGQSFPVGQLQWQLQGFSVLSLNPCFKILSRAQHSQSSGVICYSLLDNIVHGEGIDMNLPAQKISPFFNVNLEGNVKISVRQFSWDGQRFGKTSINLLLSQGYFYDGNNWIQLGDIQAQISDDHGVLHSQWLHILDDPPIALDLMVKYDHLKAPHFHVEGVFNPKSQANELYLLVQMSQPMGNGQYFIEIKE